MNNIKLIIFDVDGTLTTGESPVEIEVLCDLSIIDKSGVNICIASGKDWRYLLGFVRGAGLSNPTIIAENGGVIIHKGKIYVAEEDKMLCKLIVDIKEMFPMVDFQPNMSNISICIDDNDKLLAEIYKFVCNYLNSYNKYSVYLHKHSIDILPTSNNKANAIKRVQSMFKCGNDETICVGDGENDRSMLQCTNNMLVVGEGLPDVKNVRRFKNTKDMIRFIMALNCKRS